MAKADLISRGTLICDPGDFAALQNSAGTASLETSGYPAGPTKAVKVARAAIESFGQLQHASPYFDLRLNAADWKGLLVEVYNPHAYPVAFAMQMYDDAAVYRMNLYMAVDVGDGWQLCFIPKSNFAANSWTADKKLRFVRFTIAATDALGWPFGNGDGLYFGRVYSNPVQRPVFLLATDDAVAQNISNGGGFPTGYPASGGNYKDICDHYGFRATAYVVPTWVGTAGYLTWEQLAALRDAGWTIGSHSNTHPQAAGNPGLRLLGPYGITQGYTGAAEDDSAIYEDIMTAVEEMRSRGFRDALHFALPQGGWDTYVRTACLRAGLKSVRAISSPTTGFPIRGAKHVGGGNYGAQIQTGWFELAGAIQIDGTPTLTNIQAYVDEVIRVGATGSCYTHGINAATAVKFDGLCSYLKTKQDAGLIRVMTVADYYDSIADWSGWTHCTAPLPLSAQPCKSHALPIGTGKITIFDGVASAGQITEAQ